MIKMVMMQMITMVMVSIQVELPSSANDKSCDDANDNNGDGVNPG